MLDIKLKDIEKARESLKPFIRKTPLIRSEALSTRFKKEILLKCENLQITGSFKIRGATHCILQNLVQAKKSGVITASAGNHAQGVAAISQMLGVRATIIMPTVTPAVKVYNTQRWGAHVELVGGVYDESFDHAMQRSENENLLFIHPFKDPLVIAAQGTIGLELVEEALFQSVESIVIPVGGGGIASGCATALRSLKPGLRIYGVSAKNAPAMWNSFHCGKAVEEPVQLTLADGVAAKRADPELVAYLKKTIDDYFGVSEESIAHAISLLAENGKLVVEGAGALSLASLIENQIPEKNICLVLSGGNIDPTTLASVFQRGLVAQGRRVHLIVTISDHPGGLHALTDILAQKKANILQVFHQRTATYLGVGEANVEIELETRGPEHTQEILEILAQRGFNAHRVS